MPDEEANGGGILGGEELLGGLDEPVPERPARGRRGSPRRRRPASDHGDPDRPRRPRRTSGETLKRILVALPWIAFAIAIVVAGGAIFAAAMIAIGGLCLREFFDVTHDRRPVQIPVYITILAAVLAAYFGDVFHVMIVVVASLPLLFIFSVDPRRKGSLVISVSLGMLAVIWIGLPLAHAVFLRELPDHGASLLVNVLVGTFVSDTAAYATGRMFGHRRIFPRISPNKTLEGLIGGFVIGALAVWFAGLYQDWLSGTDALLIGLVVAAIAPLGDLFESAFKRDIGIKDTGTIFGPHGGMLDRLDAVLFTVVAGYYISLALVY